MEGECSREREEGREVEKEREVGRRTRHGGRGGSSRAIAVTGEVVGGPAVAARVEGVGVCRGVCAAVVGR